MTSKSSRQVLPSSRADLVQKPLLGLGQAHRAQPYPPFMKHKPTSLKPPHPMTPRPVVPFEEHAFNICECQSLLILFYVFSSVHEHPPAVALPPVSLDVTSAPVSFHQTLEHPASKQKYSVTTADLCSFLQKKGKLIEDSHVPSQKTSDEINELIRKFCSAKDLTFMTQSEFHYFE